LAPCHHGVTCGIAAARPVALANRLCRFGGARHAGDYLSEGSRSDVAGLVKG